MKNYNGKFIVKDIFSSDGMVDNFLGDNRDDRKNLELECYFCDKYFFVK